MTIAVSYPLTSVYKPVLKAGKASIADLTAALAVPQAPVVAIALVTAVPAAFKLF